MLSYVSIVVEKSVVRLFTTMLLALIVEKDAYLPPVRSLLFIRTVEIAGSFDQSAIEEILLAVTIGFPLRSSSVAFAVSS